MEFINKVELQGLVHNIYPSQNVTKVSMYTEQVFKTSEGTPVIQTTWMSVVIPKHLLKDIPVGRGDAINVKGMFQTAKYATPEGERVLYEVRATDLKRIAL